MDSAAVTLPPGFTLDQQAPAAPSLPEGFQLDQPHSSIIDSLKGEAAKFALPPDQIGQKMSEGIPVLGPMLDKGKAAIDAAATGIARSTGLDAMDKYGPQTKGLSSAPDFSARYAENLKNIHQQSAQTQQQYPIGSEAAKIVGGMAVMAPLIAGAPAAFGIGAGSLPARTFVGALTGGGIGGADAVSRGDNIGTGMAIGAAGGAVAPVLGSAIGAGANLLRGADKGVLADVNPMAIDWAKKALRADGVAPAEIEATFRRLGPEGFLAEYGPNTKGVTSTMAGMPGEGKAEIVKGFQNRAAGEHDVITGALDKAFGAPTNVIEKNAALIGARSAAANPLYEQWRNTEVFPTPKLKELMPRLNSLGVFNDAQKLMQAEGKSFGDNFFTTGAQKNFPTAEAWDYAKRSLDDIIQANMVNGRANNTARIATGLKSELLGAIDKHPDPAVANVWKKARDTFADHSSVINALEKGQEWRTLHKNELDSLVKGFSPPEKEAFMQGMRADIADIAEATKRGDTRARDLFLAEGNKAKASSLIGEDNAKELYETMNRASERAANVSQVIGNSQTFPRQAMQEMMTPNPKDTIVHRAKEMYSPHVTPLNLFIPKHLENVAANRQASQYEAARNALAPMLMKQGPEAQRLVEALITHGQNDPGRNAALLSAILMQGANRPAQGRLQ